MSEAKGPAMRMTASAAVVDARLTAYQLTVGGLRLPVLTHYAFNAVAAGGIWMLGHPALAACLFLSASAFDTVQQALIKRWLAASVGADEVRGFRRLAVLCVARVGFYTAPTFALAAGGGLPEHIIYGVQLTTLLITAMGAGALSRTVFWSLTAPVVAQFVVLLAVRFDPMPAGALATSVAVLAVLLVMISESTVRAISTWHAAFLANVNIVDDLAAARDQAVAERLAADSAREAARQANRAKSDFLATMSHEIRTPMNGVLGMAQLMKRDETNPVQAGRLDVLIDSGEYLLSILNDILDVSKIDAGKLEMVTAAEDLPEFLDRVVSFWGPRAGERGIALELRIAPDVPACVFMDALRLRQVMFNLLGNALKFTGLMGPRHRPAAPGRSRHRRRHRTPSPAAPFRPLLPGRRVRGPPLQRHRPGPCHRQAVGRVDGRPRLGRERARPGIHLPRGGAARGGPWGRLRLGRRAQRAAVNLLVLEQLLTSLGHTVVKAGSGADAMEALGEETFDLLLTDIQMPGMTGIEVLQALRTAPGPNQAIPVIALTADVTSGGRQRYLDQGFTEHAAKPIQLQDLLGAVVRAVSAGPVASSRVA
jgi:signal transduction histidine kinase/CheY-like chemotaxis protein